MKSQGSQIYFNDFNPIPCNTFERKNLSNLIPNDRKRRNLHLSVYNIVPRK